MRRARKAVIGGEEWGGSVGVGFCRWGGLGRAGWLLLLLLMMMMMGDSITRGVSFCGYNPACLSSMARARVGGLFMSTERGRGKVVVGYRRTNDPVVT